MGIHRKSIGKPQNYSNPEETKGKHYENHRKPWESDSNLWETIGNDRKTMGKRQELIGSWRQPQENQLLADLIFQIPTAVTNVRRAHTRAYAELQKPGPGLHRATSRVWPWRKIIGTIWKRVRGNHEKPEESYRKLYESKAKPLEKTIGTQSKAIGKLQESVGNPQESIADQQENHWERIMFSTRAMLQI